MSTEQSMAYLMVIRREPEGFSAEFPDLPGCFTQAETLDELRANALEAVELYVSVLREKGEPIPEPTSMPDTVTVKAS